MAFENDFGEVPEGGHWIASYTVEQDGARAVAKPLSYTYRNKSKKIEVRKHVRRESVIVKGIRKNDKSNS